MASKKSNGGNKTQKEKRENRPVSISQIVFIVISVIILFSMVLSSIATF